RDACARQRRVFVLSGLIRLPLAGGPAVHDIGFVELAAQLAQFLVLRRGNGDRAVLIDIGELAAAEHGILAPVAGIAVVGAAAVDWVDDDALRLGQYGRLFELDDRILGGGLVAADEADPQSVF